MGSLDLLRLAWGAVMGHRLRSALTMLGVLIGIASVILLTSIGEGSRQYILSEFTQFGTNIMGINPGRTMTSGQPGALAGTYRRLTIEDAEALHRIPGVDKVVPVVIGMAEVRHGQRGRSVFVYGVNSQVPDVWKFRVRQGSFLPPGDPRRSAPLVVLGPKLKREIFGEKNALGRYVRIGEQRLMVLGVMAPKGILLGWDVDDSAYIPVATAQKLFNRNELFEIDLLFSAGLDVDRIVDRVKEVLISRHDGEEDFTITTQNDMLSVLDRVMDVVSIAVGGIGGISLVVGAIGILTIMWISVRERTAEIGLAKAIGASPGQILRLFLVEAAVLSAFGGILGIVTGISAAWAIKLFVPGLPVHTPVRYVVAALAVSLAVGLLSGALPARRAAGLDPVRALRTD